MTLGYGNLRLECSKFIHLINWCSRNTRMIIVASSNLYIALKIITSKLSKQNVIKIQWNANSQR